MAGKTAAFALFALFLAGFVFADNTGVNVTVVSACTSNVNGNLTLSNNVSANGTCFIITADDVTFDCAGYTVTGNNSGFAIYANGRENLVIRDCVIQNFSDAIHFDKTNVSLVTNNTARYNIQGVCLNGSSSDNVTANTAANNSKDFQLILSSSNLLSGNTGTNTTSTVFSLESSDSNNMSGNSGAGELGFDLSNSSHNFILDNNDTSGTYGIRMWNASDSNLVQNHNGHEGVRIEDSHSNNVSFVTVTDQGSHVITFEGNSTGNRAYNITGTNLSATYAIWVTGTSSGNYLADVGVEGIGTYGLNLDVSGNDISNVNITGFSTGAIVHGSSAAGQVLENMRVINSSSAGIIITHATNATVNNSYVSCPAGTGVLFSSIVEDAVNDSSLLNSEISGNLPVYLEQANRITVDNNSIYATGSGTGGVNLMPPLGGGGGGSCYGGSPLIYICSFSNITNNLIVCNATGGCSGSGIAVIDDNNLIMNNSIYNFTDGAGNGVGIYLNNSESMAFLNNITGNYIHNSSVGIYTADGADNNTFDSNTVNITSEAGIVIDNGGQYSTITNNTVAGTTLSGIYVDHSSSHSVVSNNMLSGIGMTGIYLDYGSGNALVSNNRIEGAKYGMYIGNWAVVDNCNITGNNVTNVSGDAAYSVGLFIYGSGNRADSNRFVNTTYGMQFWKGPNTADSNYIADNDYGVAFLDYDASGAGSNVSNSTITNSANYDVQGNMSCQDTLINTTFNKGKVSFPMSDDSNVTVMWYVRANVTNWAGTAITGANVTITDVNGAVVLSEITASPTSFSEFTEYIANVTENVSFNNYTANTTKAVGCGTRFNVTEQNLTESTTWEITLDNAAPTIDSMHAKSAEDPLSCANTTIGAIQFDVTDLNGVCELNLSETYVNLTKGSATRASLTCVNDSSTETTMTISCTGADLYYWDSPGSWALGAYTTDSYDSATNGTGTMAYNEGIYMAVNNGPINFGNVAKGTSDNLNLNLPATNLENCGNVALNDTITGANITDTTGDYWIPADLFKANNESGTGGAITLTEAAQEFQPSGGIIVSTGPASTWDTYYFVTILTTQYATTYANGTWTFTPSKA